MVDSLNKNSTIQIKEKEKLLIQIAGLIHDLGHGPFSHLWDTFLEKCNKKSKHEQRSYDIFRHFFPNVLRECKELNKNNEKLFSQTEKDLIESFNDADYEFIKNVIDGESNSIQNNKYLYQIICNKKNHIDVDKWDYLARDAKHFNLGNSFDFERIMNNARIMPLETGENEIVFRDKNKLDLELMFDARRLNHIRGYQHHLCKLYEEKFIEILMLAVKENVQIEGKSCKFEITSTEPEKFIQLTDHILWDLYRNSKTQSLTENIISRRKYNNENDNKPNLDLTDFGKIKIRYYDSKNKLRPIE